MKYSEFRPTCFDRNIRIKWEPSEELERLRSLDILSADEAELLKKLEHEEDRNNWIVADITRNRDSGPLHRSNFKIYLQELGGESDTVEVHRFGHWGRGWYEIIIYRPGSEAEKKAYDLDRALANYPILDENDHSETCWEEFIETWNNCYSRDFCRFLRGEFKTTFNVEELMLDHQDEVFQFYLDNTNETYTETNSGIECRFPDIDRETFGSFIYNLWKKRAAK